jgi:hypothetical protein
LNLLQRLILVIVLVIVGLVVTVILLQPDLIARLDSGVRVILALLIDLVLFGMLAVVLRRERVPNETALMVRAPGAVADVSVASARERILRAVRSVPGVTSAEAKVEAVRSRAEVELDVIVTGSNVSVPQKQKEIDRALRQVIQKQLGLQMAHRPRVHIQLESEQTEVPPTRVEQISPAVSPPAASEAIPAPLPLPAASETKPVTTDTRDINEEPDFVREKTSFPSARTYEIVTRPVEKPASEADSLLPVTNNAHRDLPSVEPPPTTEPPTER